MSLRSLLHASNPTGGRALSIISRPLLEVVRGVMPTLSSSHYNPKTIPPLPPPFLYEYVQVWLTAVVRAKTESILVEECPLHKKREIYMFENIGKIEACHSKASEHRDCEKKVNNIMHNVSSPLLLVVSSYSSASFPLTLSMGASRWSKASSITTAEISAPMPFCGHPSSTVISRLVFITELMMVP